MNIPLELKDGVPLFLDNFMEDGQIFDILQCLL